MEAIIVTAITVLGGGIIKVLSDYINSAQKNQKELTEQLLNRMDTMELNQEELKSIGSDNRDGAKNILRYSVRQEMKSALERGYETSDNYEETANLFQSYARLGGNGVIHDMYEMYKKLPIKGD